LIDIINRDQSVVYWNPDLREEYIVATKNLVNSPVYREEVSQVKKNDLEQIIATGREKGARYFVVKLK
jgi:hypothetical protein